MDKEVPDNELTVLTAKDSDQQWLPTNQQLCGCRHRSELHSRNIFVQYSPFLSPLWLLDIFSKKVLTYLLVSVLWVVNKWNFLTSDSYSPIHTLTSPATSWYRFDVKELRGITVTFIINTDWHIYYGNIPENKNVLLVCFSYPQKN